MGPIRDPSLERWHRFLPKFFSGEFSTSAKMISQALRIIFMVVYEIGARFFSSSDQFGVTRLLVFPTIPSGFDLGFRGRGVGPAAQLG